MASPRDSASSAPLHNNDTPIKGPNVVATPLTHKRPSHLLAKHERYSASSGSSGASSSQASVFSRATSFGPSSADTLSSTPTTPSITSPSSTKVQLGTSTTLSRWNSGLITASESDEEPSPLRLDDPQADPITLKEPEPEQEIKIQEIGETIDQPSSSLVQEVTQALASVKAMLSPDINVNEVNPAPPSGTRLEVLDPTREIRLPPTHKPTVVPKPPQLLPDDDENEARATAAPAVEEMEPLPAQRAPAQGTGHYAPARPVVEPETKEDIAAEVAVDDKEKERGLRNIKLQKHAFQVSILLVK